MFYIFKKDPQATTPVKCIKAETATILRSELKKASPNALFIYDEQTDEINMLSEFYDALECSYFIYAQLGIFKPLRSLKLTYTKR